MTPPQSQASPSEQETDEIDGDETSSNVYLPSIVTLLNALVGLMAVSQTFKAFLSMPGFEEPAVPVFGQYLNALFTTPQDHLRFAGWLILSGMVLDALDGKLARMTDSTSIFGIELDSLCDAVTFGVAPALLTWVSVYFLRVIESPESHPFLFAFSFPVAVLYLFCVLIRLARFNVSKNPEADDHGDFNGLPSPAAAGVIASGILLMLSLFGDRPIEELVSQPTVEIGLQVTPWIVALLSLSMVSNFRYPHLMDQLNLDDLSTRTMLSAVVLGIALLYQPETTLFLIFFLYAAAGPLDTLMHKITAKTPAD